MRFNSNKYIADIRQWFLLRMKSRYTRRRTKNVFEWNVGTTSFTSLSRSVRPNGILKDRSPGKTSEEKLLTAPFVSTNDACRDEQWLFQLTLLWRNATRRWAEGWSIRYTSTGDRVTMKLDVTKPRTNSSGDTACIFKEDRSPDVGSRWRSRGGLTRRPPIINSCDRDD